MLNDFYYIWQFNIARHFLADLVSETLGLCLAQCTIIWFIIGCVVFQEMGWLQKWQILNISPVYQAHLSNPGFIVFHDTKIRFMKWVILIAWKLMQHFSPIAMRTDDLFSSSVRCDIWDRKVARWLGHQINDYRVGHLKKETWRVG